MYEKSEIQNYKKGSYIMLEGQSAPDCFYILVTGSVERCISRFLISNRAVRECKVLSPGDLFGVISFMAQRPRIESAVALEDSSVISVTRTNLSRLLGENSDTAMKILRHFSKQLRFYDSIVTTLNAKTPHEIFVSRGIEHLFAIAKYHWKKKEYHLAGYALSRYLSSDKAVSRESAEKILQKIKGMKSGMFREEPLSEGRYVRYLRGQPIFMEGEIGDTLYVIEAGSVRITKMLGDREVLLNVLGPGQIFGEMALIEERERNSTAVAAGEVKLLPVSRSNFELMVLSHPEMVSRIFELLADRLWLVFLHIANLFISDSETRLYDALNIQLIRQRVATEEKKAFTFSFSIEDLLRYTGMDNEDGEAAVQRMLLSNDLLCVNEDGKITVSDVSDITRRVNILRRDAEVERNMRAGDYSFLLDKG